MKVVSVLFRIVIAAGCVAVLPGLVMAWSRVLDTGFDDWSDRAAFATGAVGYVVVHSVFRTSMRGFQAFVHECAHAFAAALCLRRITQLHVDEEGGGYVRTHGNNFFILLAPYWMPLLALPFLAAWPITEMRFRFLLEGAFGAAFVFHLFLFSHQFAPRQTDLEESGYVFSAVFAPTMLVAAWLVMATTMVSDIGYVPRAFVYAWGSSKEFWIGLAERGGL